MTLEEARAALLKLQARQSAYAHAMDLIWYDGDTAAPKGTAANRAHSLEILSEEAYRISTGAETVALLEFLDEHKAELSARERRMVELLLKEIRRLQRIPLDEYTAHQRLTVEAGDVWERAKAASNFALFEPYLERLFDDAKRFARYCAPDKDPYDYWLNEFEEGLDQAKCDAFFSTLRAHIVPLLAEIRTREPISNAMLMGHFPAPEQEKLARRIMDVMGLDPAHVGLASTEHPFTASLGSHFDERITTHYYEDYVASSLYSVIHEGGHALYDTNSADDLAYTVLDGGVSMGIHESQSRFFENLLGRSRPFCEYLFPVLKELFPAQMAGHTAEEFYRAVNRAEPDLIRTEADELTYPLHIMVRYELEKRLMAGGLTVRELPGEWNRLYREYLGVEVPDDAHGVLQDIHWAQGAIGYFPSYAFGSAYGAQFLRRMRETVDVDGCLRAGNFAPINRWLRERVWRFGRAYKPAELFERATGEAFDPTAFTSYLEEKFGELYQL